MRRQDSSGTDSPVDQGFQGLHKLFEKQVEKTPDSVALIFESQCLTYRELNERANKLAHHLCRSGVKPETLVAVCLERSLEMVVGLFGILKAGAAYVPVDPAYPAERFNFMLQDCRSPVLLTQHHLIPSLPASGATMICLDSGWEEIEKEAADNPSIDLTMENLAYVIYTSGSTGKPKGAMNTHAGIFNRLRWMQDTYRLDASDRVLQKTPFSFDVSVWEFFWPLMTGASMVIARPLGHHDNAYLVNLIDETNVTTLHFVPSMLQVMLEEPDLRNRCESLRRVICSGEALSYDLQIRFFKLCDAELHNLYGPTEAAVDVTYWQCERDSELRIVPIGRAIANVEIQLLDQDLQPVNPGDAGELHIGGVCLARGYVHRSDLTAASFIPHPFAKAPGERLYKTGDLARSLPEEVIEYLGRIDQQLKICGVRIELGELEAAILEHASVRETVVIAREDRPGDRRLVAYLVAENADLPSPNELRGFLEKLLPHYMVPSAFVWLEKLPLTPNGKIDRRQLPAPADFPRETEQLAPRTSLEELIAGTWCEVMNISSVGVHDNFFELGGHSLLAALIVSPLRRSLQIELWVHDIFDSPTVAKLAARIETRLQTGQLKTALAPLRRNDRRKPFKLSHTQQRLWFLHRLKPRSAFYNLPLVVRLRGRLNVSALQESFNEISRRHEVLRTKFVAIDEVPVQVIDEPSPQPLKAIEAQGETESMRAEAALRMINEEVRTPFELTNNYLWRTLLVRVSDEEHLLAIVMQHIVSDGWSLNVLAQELSVLYSAYSEGHSSPLNDLAVQWVDYAEWQRKSLSPEDEERQLKYWQEQLAGSTPVLQLPSDRPRPSVESHEGCTYYTTLPSALAESLKSLSRRESSTLFMTLLAAFNVLISRYTGQSDITVGTPLAGRSAPELEHLIGFFVNTVAIRTKLSGNLRFRDLLQRVRETIIAAYAHQDVQFDKIVEELQVERSLSYAPVFQVVFAFNHTGSARFEMQELESTLLETDTKTSKFDLSFFVEDAGAELKLAVEYSTALFDAGTIRRLTTHFETLLESISADPDQAICDLKLLTGAENRQLLSQGKGADREFPQQTCIQELFERQVQNTPDAAAIVCVDQRVTYSELNRRANQMARYLQSRGVGPETIIGLCMTRSLNMIAGALAVLKAGGAYAPLDPAYPKERLAFMLEEAGAPLLLTERAVLERLPACQAEIICLEDEKKRLAAESDSNPAASVRPDNLAYVIFTSGSTGKPKGVAVTHAGLVNLACWHQGTHQVDYRSKASLVAGPSFDAAVWELWANLTAGATLFLPGEETILSAMKFWQWLQDENITHCFLPTPLVETLLPVCEASFSDSQFSGSALRYLFTGGDKLHRRPNRDLPFHLINLYGLSETTVINTAAVTESRVHNDSAPSIGRPISNSQVYILDQQLNQVPVGVIGELYISGVGLGRCYLNQPEMTATKFISNPYAERGGERMYGTGDLARHLPDGSIECLGRVDDQVKLRGFRIELGEIETALNQHQGVREAAVVLRPDGRGSKQIVAYVVESSAQSATADELRRYLKHTLPDYMVPAVFVALDALPLTPNGKVDHKRLPDLDNVKPELQEHYVSPRSDLERAIAKIWQDVLQVTRVGIHDNFFNLGGHSLLLVQVNNRLREVSQADISLIDMFQYPTVSALAEYLGQSTAARDLKNSPPKLSRYRRETGHEAMEVAIIGMAGRFPGAKDLSAFWENLKNGIESITFFSAAELRAEGVNGQLGDPNYVPAKAVLEDVEMFDAAFFDYNPREAEMLDPQHRVLLECAAEALEHAGYDPDRFPGSIGVYAGVSAGSYRDVNLNSHPDLIEKVGPYQVEIGNRGDFVPTTISFKLNLKGPSLNIQTACSTSLVAVHTACQSLLNGDCDIALAGGASITFPHKIGYVYQKEGIMSPDGHCRAFDEQGRGTVAGEGAGLIVLKRLDDAIAEGDTIYAVIKGSAINNDGSLKVGFTAPSIDGQAKVISEALAAAGVEAESIDYVEAHGTGTILGDPIEVAALTQAYKAGTQRRGFCAIGSLKTNIGHLDAAAGIAGLIKSTLALTHKQIPPSLHFTAPNSKINFEHSPFFVNAQLQEWQARARRRRTGVSSFGIGGTNAHVILEEAPVIESVTAESETELLILSAKTNTALENATQQLVGHLKSNPELPLADVAFTLQVGRREFAHRRMLVCRDADDAIKEFSAPSSPRVASSFEEPSHRPYVFMFPGQGTQYVEMSKELYETQPLFQKEIDHCAEVLLPHLNLDLRDLIFPSAGRREEAARLLAQTFITQPAIFTVEYALARLLMSWGLEPAAMIGHSIGEYVAACLAGVFSLEDSLASVAARGALIQQLPAGQMLAVPLPEDQVKDLLRPGLSLAVVNTPNSCVIAGPIDLVHSLKRDLSRREIHSQLLQTSHAFHSEMLEPILDEFAKRVSRVNLRAPAIPFISNVTGTWITAAEATDPDYWSRHLRQTVRFARGIGELFRNPDWILIEVGPGRTLSRAANKHPQKSDRQVIFSTLSGPQQHSDATDLFTTIGKIWLAGGRIDWLRFNAGKQRRRVPLPTYPFERKRYYVAPRALSYGSGNNGTAVHQAPIENWLYLPSWKRVAPVGSEENLQESKGVWLVFVDEGGVGSELAKRLRVRGGQVITVKPGRGFSRAGKTDYTINPRQRENYQALLKALATSGAPLKALVHLWSVTADEAVSHADERFARAQEMGLFSLLFLTQALAKHLPSAPVRLLVITNNVQEVDGNELLRPDKATVLSACKVIPLEHPNIDCRSIDVSIASTGREPRERLIAQLSREMLASSSDRVTAYRGRHRWVQTFEPVAEPEAKAQAQPLLRERGVYLITGGLSEMGLAAARFLAETARARLVLVTRDGIQRKELATLKNQAGAGSLPELEALGAELLVQCADQSDEAQMRAVLAAIESKFGVLHGVIHAETDCADGAHKKIVELTRSDCERHFQSTIGELILLEKILAGRKLDFCLVFSSLLSVLGAANLTVPVAANIFADVTAQNHQHSMESWTSVNWDTRRLENTGAEFAFEGSTTEALSLREQEVGEILSRVLSLPATPQVVVSTSDLQARLSDPQIRQSMNGDGLDHAETLPEPVHANLSKTYAVPETRTEKVLANIWQDLLGVERVGIHDNFFDLDGHSLLGTMMISRISRSFGVDLELTEIFQAPTVHTLSALIVERAEELKGTKRIASAAEDAALVKLPRSPAPRRDER